MKSIYSMGRIIALCVFLLPMLLGSGAAYGQTYATTRTSSGLIDYTLVAGLIVGSGTASTDPGVGSVTDTNFITDGIHSNFATLTAKCFNVIVVGHAGEAWIQPKFPNALPSGSTAYFRIDLPTASGFTLDLVGTVGALTNLFSKNMIIVSAYSDATTTTTGTRISDAKVTKTLVKDTAGNLYIAVTADSTFNSARIGLRFNTGLLGVSIGSSVSLNVYDGISYSTSACNGRPHFTDLGASSGLTVAVLDSVVNNPVNAIDNDLTTASRIGGSTLLGVGVASTITQSFYFENQSPPTDQVRVMLATPGTVLDLAIADGIKIAAYYHDTLLVEKSLSDLLTLSLLSFLTGSTGYPVYLNPGGSIDKVVVTYQHLVGLGLLSNGLNVYDVRYVPGKPVLSKDTVTIYQFTTPVVTATLPDVSNEVHWYNPVNTMIGTGTSFPSTDTIGSSGPYFALAVRAACNNLSDTSRLYVRVVSMAYTNPVTGTKGVAYSGALGTTAGAGISGAGFRYVLAPGNNLPAGLVLYSNGQIGGTATVTDTLTFTVLLTDTVNGLTAGQHDYQIIVRAPLAMPAMTLPDATDGVAYSVTLPSATGGTGNYTYSLSTGTPLPAGLSFDSVTRKVTGTTSAGTYTFTINVTDDEGRTAAHTYSLTVGAPLPLHLLSFEGNLTGARAVLNWKTTGEEAIDAIILQRSTDGDQWQDLQHFQPLYDLSGISSYSYTDHVLQCSGTLLYRLKITGPAQPHSYSPILKLVSNAVADHTVSLYPNPVQQGAMIGFRTETGKTTATQVTLYSSTGRVVYSGSNVSSLLTTGLSTGTYLVQWTPAGSTAVQVSRLIIE